MKLKKVLAAISAAAVMSCALPFSSGSAAQFYTYRIDDEGNAIITDVNVEGKSFIVPESITKDGVTVPIVGIDDFAFGKCDNLETVYVPNSLTVKDTGNAAFVTSTALVDFLDKELGTAANFDDFLRYIAIQAHYKNGNFTEADLAEMAVKAEKKLKQIDLSGEDTLKGKIMTLIRNVDKMDLSDRIRNYFAIWIATITYNGLVLSGSYDAPMRDYASARELLNMKYELMEYILGDANNDGKFNIRDAAFVASNVAKRITIENPAGDYNKDGIVNIRDAAAMAKALAKIVS